MSINRYDNPKIFQYQSQFVPTQLPWELMQNAAEKKQLKDDQWAAKESSLGDIKIDALRFVRDNEGNTIEVPDYVNGITELNSLQQDISNLSKEFSNVERGSKDYIGKITELSKRAEALRQKNQIWSNRKTAYESAIKERTNRKINDGEHRGTYWDFEIDKMLADETYTPDNIAYQDEINRNQRINTIMEGTKDRIQSLYAGAQGEYLRSSSRYGVTPKEVIDIVTPGFYGDKELMQDVELEALQFARRNNININKSIPVTTRVMENGVPVDKVEEVSYMDAYKRKVLEEEVIPVALKNVHSAGRESISANSNYWKNLEQEEKKSLQVGNLAFVNESIKGKGILEAYNLAEQFIETNNNIRLKEGQLINKIDKLKTKDGKIPEANMDEYLKYQAELTVLATNKMNYKNLENTIFNSYKEKGLSIDKFELRNSKLNEILKSSKSYEDFTNKIINLPNIDHNVKLEVLEDLESQYKTDMANTLQSKDYDRDVPMIYFSASTPRNKARMKDIITLFKNGFYSGQTKDEEGNLVSNRDYSIDENAGYGYYTNASGDQVVTFWTKGDPNSLVNKPKQLKMVLDDRNTLGEIIRNESYEDAKYMYQTTGNETYGKLLEEIENMIINNTEKMTGSFKESKIPEITNKLEGLQQGSAFTIGKNKNGSKTFFTFTKISEDGQPSKYKVTTTKDGVNVPTPKLMEYVSSYEEFYKNAGLVK